MATGETGGTGAQAASVATTHAASHSSGFDLRAARIKEYLDIVLTAEVEFRTIAFSPTPWKKSPWETRLRRIGDASSF
ncbi:hypothetical protein PQQ96_35765 [Paraburkholderia sediminicola]|uniref:hypothetical protein n=1 Tax=Paraburkholderia sediminicola TaxID=458836 RepID=UPI0038B94765